MSEPDKKRPYHSRLRQEAAEATHRNILEAARRLFAAHGYVPTTISAIASEAGVSVATVTVGFGTKLALLEAVVKWDVRGEATPLPLAARPWWQEILRDPDPRRRLARYAKNVRRFHERTTDLFEIVRSAAAAEPALATLRRKLGESHYQDDRRMAELLAQQGVLSGVTIELATDLLCALGSADLYRVLIIDRSWTPERYEQWLAATWIHALLEGLGIE